MAVRNWCFTINNPEDVDIPTESWGATYIVWQKEQGEQGTPHFQGYAEFETKKRLSAVKKIHAKAHWEARKGSQKQAIAYCKKEESRLDGPWELGIHSQQGARTDLQAAIEIVKESGSLKRVAHEMPEMIVKYHRGLTELKFMLKEEYTHDQVRGVWVWGEPRTGKTTWARETYPAHYIKAQNKWFDGYDGEETIILDDLDSECLGHYLKIWMDKWACKGETKGGTVHLQHHRFIVTSNYSIEDLIKDPVMAEAIRKRCDVKHFNKDFN